MFKNNYDAKEFGARIKALRKTVGMTQEELADRLILSVDSVSRMENGKIMCMPEHLVHLCEIFGVAADYFYFGQTEKSGDGQCGREEKEILSLLSGCSMKELKKVKKMIKIMLDE